MNDARLKEACQAACERRGERANTFASSNDRSRRIKAVSPSIPLVIAGREAGQASRWQQQTYLARIFWKHRASWSDVTLGLSCRCLSAKSAPGAMICHPWEPNYQASRGVEARMQPAATLSNGEISVTSLFWGTSYSVLYTLDKWSLFPRSRSSDSSQNHSSERKVSGTEYRNREERGKKKKSCFPF